MIRRPPRSTRTDTLFPYTTLFRSGDRQLPAGVPHLRGSGADRARRAFGNQEALADDLGRGCSGSAYLMGIQSKISSGDAMASGGIDTREHLVVVGNGMAGCRTVEEVLKRDSGRYRITIRSEEHTSELQSLMRISYA